MKFPPIKLDYLRTLTDDTAVLQHAKFTTPCKKEGYTTDDNTRALIACIQYYSIFKDSQVKKLIDTYLSFIFYMQRKDGKMHNFLSYNRKFIDKIGSEDCLGRTLWACGCCLNSRLPEETKMLAKDVFDNAFKWVPSFTSPRAKAFSMLGLFHYGKGYVEDRNIILNMKLIGNELISQFEQEASAGWEWFESYLTYANARLPHALFLAYEYTKEKKFLQVASSTIDFLIGVQIIKNVFVPIGNRGWYKKGGKRAVFDQQSLEASAMTEACTAALRNTQKEEYRRSAHVAFKWFLGKNIKEVLVYDEKTGGCNDGITPLGLNLNKGAESTVAYLQARLCLEESENVSGETEKAIAQ